MVRYVGIVVGSTRPACSGKSIALWIERLIQQDNALQGKYSLVDLAEWSLPMFNEPGVPARQPYVHEHTKKWSQHIESLDAFLFVTPQVIQLLPARQPAKLLHAAGTECQNCSCTLLPCMKVKEGLHSEA